MDPTRSGTHRVLRRILAHRDTPFTQLALAKAVNVSHPWAHQIVQWLIGLGHVRKTGAFFELVNPAGVISLYPIFRDMRAELVYEADVRVPAAARKDLVRALGPGAVPCLTTALAKYSDYSMPGPIQLYALNGVEAVKRRLMPYAGGTTRVQVYVSAKMPPEPDEVQDGATDPIRTTIDLACTNQLYLARDLLRTQWGIELGT